MSKSHFDMLSNKHMEKEHIDKESCIHVLAANLTIDKSEKYKIKSKSKCEVLPKTKNYLCYVKGDEENL